ncbi:TPA: 2-oxo acid dehydrogenase subunit E2 [Candidatus Woesearchaeota archaeon]|nr:2-oxo acid dehydrogenase subunit E2 [Candidatus Woesearchaeota archaeon]
MVYEFKFPDVGEGVVEGHIVKWLVKEGDTVQVDQILAEIETAKAIVEVPSPKAGRILKIYHQEGDTIKVGETLVMFGEQGEQVPQQLMPKVPTTTIETRQSTTGNLPATPYHPQPTTQRIALPATRKLAEKLGIDISKVNGTGQGGRISDEDVKAASVAAPPSSPEAMHPATQPGTPSRAGPKISFESFGRTIRVPMSNIRKVIAKRMVEAAFTIPHVTHVEEVDVTELDKIRKEKKDEAENKGFKLTFLPFVMKACIVALREHPYINASIDEEKEEIVLKKYYNIGFAVDTGQGLMVPVIKNVDNLSIMQIAKEITKLAEEARTREIQPQNLQGHSFCITNIGSVGGIMATPIINPPDSAILGMYRMNEVPRVVHGQIVPRKVMNLSLTFDHRTIDGAQAGRFMLSIKKLLEDPHQLLLDVF